MNPPPTTTTTQKPPPPPPPPQPALTVSEQFRQLQNGKPMLLEYSYDSPTRTYQISGIFPKFMLRAGEQSLEIARKAD